MAGNKTKFSLEQAVPDAARAPVTEGFTRWQWITRGVLLAIGVIYLLVLFDPAHSFRYGASLPRASLHGSAGVALLLAVLLLLLRPVRKGFSAVLDRLRHPQPRMASVIAWCMVLAAMAFLYCAGVAQDRCFTPVWHDEFSTLLQARMFSQGHLYMPAHPLPEFFDTFHVLITPAYASIYFPGAALLYVPGIWLGWPVWMMPLLVSAAAVGLLYRVVCEIMDGVWGLLAAMLLMGNGSMRMLSLMFMSHNALLLGGLAVIWAYLNWRKSKHIGWALGLGFVAGWTILIRPADAMYYILPVGLAMLMDLRGQSRGRIVATIACGLLMLVPFAAIQLAINHGVTGKWLTTPYSIYHAREYPQLALGFHKLTRANIRHSSLPQKEVFNTDSVLPQIIAHNNEGWWNSVWRTCLPVTLLADSACPLLLLLMPLGILGLRCRSRWALAAALPLHLLLYGMYAMFADHYAAMAAPAVVLLILLGASAAGEMFPRGGYWQSTVMVMLVGALALQTMIAAVVPQWLPRPDQFVYSYLDGVNAAIDATVGNKKAIVLFHYDPGSSPHFEPVYNWHNSWPDDADIIRAHDRGADNKRLYQYYAARYPRRGVYLIDRGRDLNIPLGDGRLVIPGQPPNPRYLGTVSELAAP